MNPAESGSTRWHSEYDALAERAGLVRLGHRTQVELSGADRAAFLHNLCTNEIRKLAPGAGCEAFLTTVQGKTLAHVLVFVGAESIILSTVAGEGETIVGHLDHYLVSERVELADRSGAWCELYLGGPRTAKLLAELTHGEPPQASLAHAAAQFEGRTAWIRRAPLAGPEGALIAMAKDDLPAVSAALVAAGATECGFESFEAARIEWGFPWFGRDITAANLPQEVARDTQAISFVKGCYLGQETVARIDALGHVNKTLVGLRFAGPQVPEPGLVLTAGSNSVGEVTSAAWSPRLSAPVALGYCRRGHNTPGSRLESAAGAVEVVALPMVQGSANATT